MPRTAKRSTTGRRNTQRQSRKGKGKGGWAVFSLEGIGGSVHQFSAVLSYIMYTTMKKTTLDFSHDSVTRFVMATTTPDLTNDISNYTHLNNLANIKKASQASLASADRPYDKVLDIVVGAMMPDSTQETFSVCLDG